MAATAKKMKADAKEKKLRVIKGGKSEAAAPASKAPPKGKVKEKSGKKGSAKPSYKKPGIWYSVLRLPEKTADRVKKAAEKNGVSVNAMIETCVEFGLKNLK